jgi:hypothetical protein
MNNFDKRKSKNEEFLKSVGIEVNDWLPSVESEKDVRIRSTKEIAERAISLAMMLEVAYNTEDKPFSFYKGYLKKYNIYDNLSPNEKEFLNDPSEEDRIQMSWKCECLWVLMWILGEIPELGFPDKLCDFSVFSAEDYPIGENKNPNDFINKEFKIRSKKEILDALDFYYRVDWACCGTDLQGREMEKANPAVVYERHYVLNWLTFYGENWDDITCDT